MKKQLANHLQKRLDEIVGKRAAEDKKIIKKLHALENRKAEIVKVLAEGKVDSRETVKDQDHLKYRVHLKYLIKQSDSFYMEEEVERRKACFYKGEQIDDVEMLIDFQDVKINEEVTKESEDLLEQSRIHYTYDRLNAVRYAERWWNDYNPAYKKFDVDCTNFISQCLHVGGAPMRGHPNRSAGWWHQYKNWSYSWAVANSLRLYLQNSNTGLRAKEVNDPRALRLGDVICYDFQGDGRFDHNTIVTGKDPEGMPLVNAHTYNSRMRYWAYEDSTAYTPNIKYKMFTIIDDA
ncbi:amidase domain-containing protein [Bacillus sp. FJAT-50079]|uniref:amidase domain-containing protein n=1 Tax=Bacillus sp. FJAT-50079 TaxID=2833577 RepID=UPI001BC9E3CF|nr:amidase domain-containing protein [Bacillus sp. FJAT-50079]